MFSYNRHVQKIARRRPPARNAAFGFGEIIVSLALLTAALVGIGRFVHTVQAGLKERELSHLIGWEIANVRDTISTWKLEDISVERIESLPIPKVLSARVGSAHWRAIVDPVEQPVHGLRVTLAFKCVLHEQESEPEQLVFWIATHGEGDE